MTQELSTSLKSMWVLRVLSLKTDVVWTWNSGYEPGSCPAAWHGCGDVGEAGQVPGPEGSWDERGPAPAIIGFGSLHLSTGHGMLECWGLDPGNSQQLLAHWGLDPGAVNSSRALGLRPHKGQRHFACLLLTLQRPTTFRDWG